MHATRATTATVQVRAMRSPLGTTPDAGGVIVGVSYASARRDY
jgi:hypothetical protein